MGETEKRTNLFFSSAQASNSVSRSESDSLSLKVVMTGSGSGSVTLSPKLSSYTKGQVVSLRANADAGSKFVGWSGDLTGTHFACNLRMDSAKSVSAKFVVPEFFALSTFSLTQASNPVSPSESDSLSLKVVMTGSGSGSVTLSPKLSSYTKGQVVSLSARANAGSEFVGWSGDLTGAYFLGNLRMDSAKSVSAKFVAPEFFTLSTAYKGTGRGIITRSPTAEKYVQGSTVNLTARPVKGSKFVGWQGDASGLSATCSVTMDSVKNISAAFVELEEFALTVVSTGTGGGEITRSLDAKKYIDGTAITLTARANKGSKFKCWHGAEDARSATCTITMDSAKTVSAEFVKLASFVLDVTATGTGRGSIGRSIDSPSYFSGAEVTLTALAEEGSIFNGWHGDVTMMDEAITVTMSSAYSISAEFVQLAIADTEVSAELLSIARSEVKRDQTATVFRLMLRNNGEQQVRIKVPLTSYVSQSGQASEQISWSTELVNGSKGVTLATGTFCEMGLVHFKQPANGDRLYVTVEQVQPSARTCFTFQCTGDWDDFLLINSSLESLGEAPNSKATYPAMASALKRIESLESTLAEVLRRLDAMQQSLPMAGRNIPSNQTGPVETLSEVFAWVAMQDRIAMTELRARLLPLDLLPSSVINDINERALDLTGELALEEVGHEIVISRVVLNEIINKIK